MADFHCKQVAGETDDGRLRNDHAMGTCCQPEPENSGPAGWAGRRAVRGRREGSPPQVGRPRHSCRRKSCLLDRELRLAARPEAKLGELGGDRQGQKVGHRRTHPRGAGELGQTSGNLNPIMLAGVLDRGANVAARNEPRAT